MAKKETIATSVRKAFEATSMNGKKAWSQARSSIMCYSNTRFMAAGKAKLEELGFMKSHENNETDGSVVASEQWVLHGAHLLVVTHDTGEVVLIGSWEFESKDFPFRKE